MASRRLFSALPREHGAWGILLQPFLGALVVLRSLDWPVLPAATSVLLVFLIREPLLVLARQKWVWREEHPETAEARRWLALESGLLAATAVWLLLVWPPWILAVLGSGAALLTALAIYVTIQNCQRAPWFQALSAAGLSSSCVAASLAVLGRVPGWVWWWWGLHAAHFLTGILVVHVRLDARAQARKRLGLTAEYLKRRREAVVVLAMMAAAGFGIAFLTRQPLYAAAVALSGSVQLRDLYTAHKSEETGLPMVSVGKRALALSIAFTLIMIAGAWREG